MAGHSPDGIVGFTDSKPFANLVQRLQAAEDNLFLHGVDIVGVRNGLLDFGSNPCVRNDVPVFDSMVYRLRTNAPSINFRRFRGNPSTIVWPSHRWGKITCNESEDVLEFVVL